MVSFQRPLWRIATPGSRGRPPHHRNSRHDSPGAGPAGMASTAALMKAKETKASDLRMVRPPDPRACGCRRSRAAGVCPQPHAQLSSGSTPPRLRHRIGQSSYGWTRGAIGAYIHTIQTPFTYTHQKRQRADIIKRIRKSKCQPCTAVPAGKRSTRDGR